jgi:UDP-2,4-diacetamido-2,4,6-trideoxy-beta-L-altropyranose hydrolase
MKIGIRADSSFKIGTGHIHRCLPLSKEFKKKNVKTYFLTRNLSGNINSRIIKNGFKIKNIKIPNKKKADVFSKKQVNLDANKTILHIKKLNIKLIFVDHYFLNKEWEKKVSRFCKVALIDDFLKRKSFCDYYINYHLLKDKRNISKKFLKKNCKKILGPRYAIIKNLKGKKIKSESTPLIFVFMGGIDSKNYTCKIIYYLKNKKFQKYKIIILIGEKNLHKQKILPLIKKNKNFLIKIGNLNNLFYFFKKSSLVISGAGVTMYEHLYAGSNSLVIPQSNLQRRICENYDEKKIINYIKSIKELNLSLLSKCLKNKLTKATILKRKILFDGNGAARLANHFIKEKI